MHATSIEGAQTISVMCCNFKHCSQTASLVSLTNEPMMRGRKRSKVLVLRLCLVEEQRAHPETCKTSHLLNISCIHYFRTWFTHSINQRFSNWGPRTKEGPRRVPTGSARGFRRVVIVCTVLTIYHPCVFKFAHISQSLSLSALWRNAVPNHGNISTQWLRGSVAMVWHDRLSVDVS